MARTSRDLIFWHQSRMARADSSEFARNGHGDFAEVNFAGRAGNRDVVTTFHCVAVAAEGTGGFVDRDFGSTDDGGDAPCGLCGCASLFF